MNTTSKQKNQKEEIYMRKSINMSRRGFIRLISFLTAGVLAFAVMSCIYYSRNVMAKRHIEYSYLRALENLSLSMDNIKTSLNKGIYSNSPQTMNDLSGKMSSDALAAKMALAQLPVTELNLENTNKFLSQVGNFSHSLARRFADGEELTGEDRDNLVSLLDHAENLSSELWGVENMVAGGHLNFEEVVHGAAAAGNEEPYPAHVSTGFENVEGLFEEYPSLIYDGPFSDHISQQEPLMLKGKQPVTKEESLEIAKKVSNSEHLEFSNDKEGLIPAYNYSDNNTTVTFTKDGGLFLYMLKYRQVGEKTISTEKAIELAEDYLKTVGFPDMVHTYYELGSGVCTINFASNINDVTVYTDLIKVGVALDNGEIMSLDARGFITAHHQRQVQAPTVTQEQAAETLSSHLKVQNVKLAVIPSMGKHERLCYEFLCTSERGSRVLVYVNAESGKEEQILLMQISDNGTLVV